MYINLQLPEDEFIKLHKNKLIDSMEEVYFIWWLIELYKHNFITDVYYNSNTFELSPQVKIKKPIQLKTMTKIVERELLKPHYYTPDFKIQWKADAHNIFTRMYVYGSETTKQNLFLYYDVNDPFCTSSFFEIKGNFSQHGQKSDIIFKLNQKWLFHSKQIYINLVKIPDLFKTTFVPDRYLYTDLSGKPRKINFDITTIKQYVESRKD